MYDVLQPSSGGLIKAWTKDVLFEEEAKRQLERIASLPFVHKHVAVMPDVHAGIGATVGSVIPTKGAIIPAAVGVDIGCGVIAVKTSLHADDLPTSLKDLRFALEAAIPHGRSDNGRMNDVGSHLKRIPGAVQNEWLTNLEQRYSKIVAKYPKIKHDRALGQLGTLGTGNHFLEVCIDFDNCVWIMLHSGSRGVGNSIGSFFIELAKQDMRKWFINLPDANLAYLPEGTEHFDDYLEAVKWAQDYARVNRDLMLREALQVLKKQKGIPSFELVDQAINCHHNYVERENHAGANVWVTRKGAVRARKDDLGIIPGSMGTRSYIVRGKGNPESFCSCSHGAGRAMSRTEARKTFSKTDHEVSTHGVECRKDIDVIDETPRAYKDIDLVMEAQTDLVEVVATLKQVLCVKG
jgi:tRNA-splicing ligase RtcB